MHTHVNHSGKFVKCLDHSAVTPTIANNVSLVYIREYTPLPVQLPLQAEPSLRALLVMAALYAATQYISWQLNNNAEQ